MEQNEYLVELVHTQVALGDERFDGVVWNAMDFVMDDDEFELDEMAATQLVWQIVDDQFARYLHEQRSWPDVTDSDRLTSAFRELDRAGIVAREVFTCCQNCGHAEIGDEFGPGDKPRGYVFYHQQDAERAVHGEGVYLAYDGADQTAIGVEVVETLQRHQLEPVWNGSCSQRIMVPLRLRRRRVGRFAAYPGLVAEEDFTVTVEPLDGWDGLGTVTYGTDSARAWATLRLPWLPAGRRLRMTVQNGRAVDVHRDWDRLIGTLTHGRGEVTIARMQAWNLLSGLMDRAPIAVSAEDLEPILDVSYEHADSVSDGTIPLSVDECLDLLRTMPVRVGSWTNYTTSTGIVVQQVWQEGTRLWMEYLDPAVQASHGRHVTVDEAAQVLAILAAEDRVMLGELGALQTVSW